MNDDIYYDRGEFLDAAAAAEYRTSARYRDEVSAKLERSMAAGTITPMGEQIGHAQRIETRTAYGEDEGLYGVAVAMPAAHPAWAEASNVAVGTFRDLDAVALAMSAPQFSADPTYRRAVFEKVERSKREGALDPSLFSRGNPAQP